MCRSNLRAEAAALPAKTCSNGKSTQEDREKRDRDDAQQPSKDNCACNQDIIYSTLSQQSRLQHLLTLAPHSSSISTTTLWQTPPLSRCYQQSNALLHKQEEWLGVHELDYKNKGQGNLSAKAVFSPRDIGQICLQE